MKFLVIYSCVYSSWTGLDWLTRTIFNRHVQLGILSAWTEVYIPPISSSTAPVCNGRIIRASEDG